MSEQKAQELIEGVQQISSNNWVDILPVVFSALALIVSLYVAYKQNKISLQIAERQNKIALFEKRYRIVYLVKSIIYFSKMIEDEDDFGQIYLTFNTTFRYNFQFFIASKTTNNEEDVFKNSAGEYILSVSRLIEAEMLMADYLFNEYTALAIKMLKNDFIKFIYEAFNENKLKEAKEEFKNTIKMFENDSLIELEKNLEL